MLRQLLRLTLALAISTAMLTTAGADPAAADRDPHAKRVRSRADEAHFITVRFGGWWEDEEGTHQSDAILIGCYSDEEFLLPEDCDLDRGTEFRLYSATGLVGTATCSRPEPHDVFDATCMGLTSTLPESQRQNTYFGISAPWNPMPRTPRRLDLSSAQFRNLVANFLPEDVRREGLCDIVGALGVDLEGDGTEEIILAMKVYGAAWDYNAYCPVKSAAWMVAVIRDTGPENPVNIVVTEASPLMAPEWQLTGLQLFPIDANGDGIMEIVVQMKYYEWDEFYIYSVGYDVSEELLSWGYGL